MRRKLTRYEQKLLTQFKNRIKELHEKIDILVEKGMKITEEAEIGGFTFDYLVNNYPDSSKKFRELLEEQYQKEREEKKRKKELSKILKI